MSEANPLSGERAPLACSFRRLAEHLVEQILHLPAFEKMALTKVRLRRPNLPAGRVRSHGGLR